MSLPENAFETTLEIEGFGFRGEGYGTLDDIYISVPGALPGERVKVLVEAQGRIKKRRYAQLLNVVDRSTVRVDPLCDHATRCRGCHLRSASNATERQFKVDAVRQMFEKFAELELSIPVEYLGPSDIGRATGFRTRGDYKVVNHALQLGEIPMSSCPAHSEPMVRTLHRVQKVLDAGAAAVKSVRLASPVHGHGFVELHVDEVTGEVDQRLEELQSTLPAGFGIAYVFDGSRTIVSGPQRFRIPVAGLQLTVGYEDWFHSTDVANEILYSELFSWLDLGETSTLLDLGCGIGTISLLASKTATKVVGVDINRASVETARHNLGDNPTENTTFIAGSWSRVLRDLAIAKETFQHCVINPMREPIGERAMQFAASIASEAITYLAPSPESGAKDIRLLIERGWELERIAAVNLHPATYHVMMMAKLSRPKS